MPERGEPAVRGVAIVGLGHVARHHLAAIELSPRFRLTAACDPDASRFALVDDTVATYRDIDDMLAKSDAQVVVVASPNRLHVPHGIKALAAGRWLMMEKPLAESRADFRTFAAKRAELGGRCTQALHAAFGTEVSWFCEAIRKGRVNADAIRFFAGGFYDPYVEHGGLRPSARSLGGSWLDSGINALSVVFRVLAPDTLHIEDSRMTRCDAIPCREVQGTVDFRLPGGDVRGSIDTNWTLGRDSKVTVFRTSARQGYILDHSAQQVVLVEGAESTVLFSEQNELPRLTNHYVGVFADLDRQMEANEDNFDYGCGLHELLYDAEDWPPAESRS